MISSGISRLNFMWHFETLRIYTVAGKCTVDSKDNEEDKTRQEVDMTLSLFFPTVFKAVQKWSQRWVTVKNTWNKTNETCWHYLIGAHFKTLIPFTAWSESSFLAFISEVDTETYIRNTFAPTRFFSRSQDDVEFLSGRLDIFQGCIAQYAVCKYNGAVVFWL